MEQVTTVTVTFVHATFVPEHLSRATVLQDLVPTWEFKHLLIFYFKCRHVGPSGRDLNCHSDICSCNIHPLKICPELQYISGLGSSLEISALIEILHENNHPT